MNGWLWRKSNRLVYELAQRGWLPESWAARLASTFWDSQARTIYEKWGHGEAPVPLVHLIKAQRPKSILDVGCGAGQLFSLYQREGIGYILGVDISTEALALAVREYPQIPTIRSDLRELDLPAGSFDMIVSNRVLQYVRPDHIGGVIKRLCAIGRLIYLNELADSDARHIAFSVANAKHDYGALFRVQGWQLVEEGLIGKQTYRVFRAPPAGNAVQQP